MEVHALRLSSLSHERDSAQNKEQLLLLKEHIHARKRVDYVTSGSTRPGALGLDSSVEMDDSVCLF